MRFHLSPSGGDSTIRGRRFLGGLMAAFIGLAGALTASAQPVYSSPYTISTLAGAGFVFAGYQNGTGTAAQFNAPYGVAADASGNVYVADSANYVIRKITSGGVVTLLAGNPNVAGNLDGTGSGAEFGSIRGIALDGSGNLYVTDYTYGTVRKVVISSGTSSTLVPASAGLKQPVGIVFDPTSGSLYVADTGNYVIRKVTTGGSVSVYAGSVGASGGTNGTGTGAQFSYPTGVAVDGSGNVYVADYQGNTIRKIASGGVVTTFAGQFGNPGVVDGSVSGAVLNHPYGIALDSAGDIFMTDTADLVREISAAGTVSTLAGEDGQPGALNGTGVNAWFNSPAGIAANSGGSVIYVADTNSNMIRMGVPYNTAQPPQIMYQPQGVSTSAGDNVTLQVTANGVGLSYRWQFNNSNLSDGGDISGSQTSTLSITGIALNQAGNYTVVVSNSSGSVTSSPANVMVTASGQLPVITVQPAPQTVNAGANPTLSVTATGATGYQWQFNGTNITNAVTATLTLANIGTTQAGSYTVVVSNANGPVTSSPASVTVNVSSYLFNISTRGYVGSGPNQDLDAGFYIEGTGNKNILLRGDGPFLATNSAYAGLTLVSPQLTFNNAGGQLGLNTAWGGSQTLINAFNTVFAPVFAT
ncbi:MAG: immunoglobulin domain-containing protein, partial [Opitutaceae bacterium]